MLPKTIIIAILASGCAQIFGVEETSSGSLSMELRLQRVSVGGSVVFNPLDVGATAPSFLIADSTETSGVQKIASTMIEPGRWSAPLRTIEGVIYTVPDNPAPHLLSFPGFSGQELRAQLRMYEHPNPKPAPSPSPNVAVNVNLPSPYAPGEGFAVEAIGAWVYVTLPSPAAPPAPAATALTVTVPYSAFQTFVGGSVGQITSQDVVMVLRYVNGNLTGQFIAPPMDQSSNTMTLAGTMTAVSPVPFSAGVAAATVANRFAAQVPPASQPVLQWRIQASPGYAVGLPAGPSLANALINASDTTISGAYANPFSVQWHPTISYTANASRSVTVGGTSTTMQTYLQSVVEPAPGMTLDIPVGLPTMTSINGTPLNSDGMTVSLDVAKPVYVDVTTDRTQNTLYDISVVEIAVVGNQVTRTPVATVTGVNPHLPLPPRALQAGHTYSLAMQCTAGGYTNAASGDLQTFALPVSYSYQESAVFTVIAP